MRVATWNVEWAAPGTTRGRRVADALSNLGDVVVVTECELPLLPAGHIIDAGADWGYTSPSAERRKVAMWSATPWSDVDTEGDPQLPGGRFVAGTTHTDIGSIRVVGLCIPWQGAHVASGRRDRRPWEDHRTFLEFVGPVIARQPRPLIVAGDFNQRIPRARQPLELFQLLSDVVEGFDVPSAGNFAGGQLIDHVALSGDLRAGDALVIPDRTEGGRLSDHTGFSVEVGPR
ncbi:MAG: endonuclease/exonuclease/phosphatase family protein [Actinomycetes bacterium]